MLSLDDLTLPRPNKLSHLLTRVLPDFLNSKCCTPLPKRSDTSGSSDFRALFQGIDICKNEVFLLPTRVVPGNRDLEEDLSDVSEEEGVVDEDNIEEIQRLVDVKKHEGQETRPSMIEMLDGYADALGYDVDGRDRPDDALVPSLEEAASFSPFILCGEAHEVECVALWDFFGGNNYDDLNVHAGDIVCVVAEEYQ